MTQTPQQPKKLTPLVNKPVNKLGLVKPEDIVAPPRLLINGQEGFGKTSAVAFSPGACILMAAGETGYLTLLKHGLAPQIPCATLETWGDTLSQIEALISDPGSIKVVGLDALGGFERQCHQFVCDRDFGGDWGEHGFTSFQKGYEVSIGEWLKLLQLLDRLCNKGVAVVFLGHAKVKPFKNPMGADYDKYVVDVHDKTLAATARWVDAILFGTFKTITVDARGAVKNDNKQRLKGIGGADRVLYTTQRDSYVAKNRYGMPDEIAMPNDPSLMWRTIMDAMAGGKKREEELPPA